LVALGIGAASARIPGERARSTPRSVRIDGGKTVAVRRRVHPGVSLLLLRVAAAAVKVQDHRQRLTAGSLGRNVNDITAAKPAVPDLYLMAARAERFGTCIGASDRESHQRGQREKCVRQPHPPAPGAGAQISPSFIASSRAPILM